MVSIVLEFIIIFFSKVTRTSSTNSKVFEILSFLRKSYKNLKDRRFLDGLIEAGLEESLEEADGQLESTTLAVLPDECGRGLEGRLLRHFAPTPTDGH